MESIILPKRLLFTPPETPVAALTASITFNRAINSSGAATPGTGSRRATPLGTSLQGAAASASKTQHSTSPVVRYGVPEGTLGSAAGWVQPVKARQITRSFARLLCTDPDAPTTRPTSIVRYRMPDPDDWDDDEEDEAVAGPAPMAELSPVENMLQQLQLKWQSAVQVGSGLRHSAGHAGACLPCCSAVPSPAS